jgi:uncharacterized protein
MSIKTDLENNLLMALKQKNSVKKNTLRMALSSIKLAQVETGKELDDPMIFNILQKEIKTREETIAEAVKANRNEMIAPLEAEIVILKSYLPIELSDDELVPLVKKSIEDLNAKTIKDMGMVMKSVISQVNGRASNDRISKVVKDILANADEQYPNKPVI